VNTANYFKPVLAFAFGLFLPLVCLADGSNTLTQYIDPRQQTALWFGARSHWLQPWRAYLDTQPASLLRNAIGINLNVPTDDAEAVCRHLATHGFKLVRIEIGFGNMSYEDPTKLGNPDNFTKLLTACKNNHLRPLILLNSHHGVPCPTKLFTIQLTAVAKKGDREVHIAPGDLAKLVVGHSGLSQLTDYWAAEALFTRIDPDGTAELSKPLPKDLPAGKVPAATIKYLPFYPSVLADKTTVPPEFTETMNAWLVYVKAVTTLARDVLATQDAADAGFDVEVWNELTFGSNFLNINNYYEKPIVKGEWAVSEILAQTVKWIRDPANQCPGVGIGNGFNNQWPWGAGSSAPPGLTALDKHPYAGIKHFPADQGKPSGSVPLNALAQRDANNLGPDKWQDKFIPTYVSHFPEYFFSAIQTEHMCRDVSPLTTEIYGTKHGRLTHPNYPDGTPAPAPEMWITEVNIDATGADPGNMAEYIKAQGSPPVAPSMTAADVDHLKAKAILRYLTCGVNKGVARFYFFAAKDDNPSGLGLMSNAFFAALRHPNEATPLDSPTLASPTMTAVGNLVAHMAGDIAAADVHPITLEQIVEPEPRIQFQGDPATADAVPNPHPPLYNRDVLAFLPFQTTSTQHVVTVYVMTRNICQLYNPAAPATDATRFDMPPETFRLTLGDLANPKAAFSLYDPLNDKTYPVKVLEDMPPTTVDLELTDSPRLLIINE